MVGRTASRACRAGRRHTLRAGSAASRSGRSAPNGDRPGGDRLGPGTLHLPIDPDDADALRAVVGRPAKILFGERESLRNVARARALLPGLAGCDALIRVEDLSLVRDLGLLAPKLGRAKPISSSEAVAEALVFALSAPELAELRAQPGVHVVLIGLGTTGLAIAEQLAATCLRVDRGPRAQRLRLTVLDADAAATEARIDGQSPGLRSVTNLTVYGMDGEACRTRPCLERLQEIEAIQPVTAIIVATGDDARNAAIGMRLRQVQRERLFFKAPILVRNRMAPGRAPAAIDDISGGTYAFGGHRSGSQDPDLTTFEEELAKAMHTEWARGIERTSNGTRRADAPKPWDAQTSAEKRSSLLAARAAPHFLRAAGLVPDPTSPECDMRVHADAVKVLGDQKPMLEILEHERWIAEKRLDGWVSKMDGEGHPHPRDDERKIHTALVDWDDLGESDRDKDTDNVRLLIRTCADRWQPGGRAWRRRFRVGVMGPLDPGESAGRRIEEAFAAYLRAWPDDVPPSATSLEILTPDAPGFDRIAPAAMLSVWRKIAGEAGPSCRVIALRAAGRKFLDSRAAEHLAGQTDGVEAAQDKISAQTTVLEEACAWKGGGSVLRTADLRSPNLSDADLARDDTRWEANLALAEAQIDALSDLLVWGKRSDRQGRSAAIAAKRSESGRRSLAIDLD